MRFRFLDIGNGPIRRLLAETLADNNIHQVLPDFETMDQALDRSEKRQQFLFDRKNEACHELAQRLSECDDYTPCGSGACPVCYMEHRKWAIQATLALIENNKDWRFVTLVYYQYAMTDKELLSFNITKFTNMLRKQLHRSGVTNPVIGGFEVDYHKEIQRWIPHFHLLIKCNNKSIHSLRKKMNRRKNLQARNGSTNRPMLVKPLKKILNPISYLYKSYWSRIYVTKKDNDRKTHKAELRPKQLEIALLTQDRIGYNRLMYLYGVRRCKDQLLPTGSLTNKVRK